MTGTIASRAPRSRDLAIAYRIYPQVAVSAREFSFGEDKLRLSDVCLRSFKESLGEMRVKLWVLLDGCPQEYERLFRKYFDQQDLVLIRLPGIGNQATFAKQIDLLLEQEESDLVYFAEDDYFYLPGQFRALVDFLLEHQNADFVSPYDHLDYYTMDLHHPPAQLYPGAGRKWKTAASTCLTFLTRRETLFKTQATFRRYKRRSLDCSLWLSLTKQRIFNPFFVVRHLFGNFFFSKVVLKSWLYFWRQILFGRKWTLWVPVPGVATHLDGNGLSPDVDWFALLEQSSKRSILGASAVK